MHASGSRVAAVLLSVPLRTIVQCFNIVALARHGSQARAIYFLFFFDNEARAIKSTVGDHKAHGFQPLRKQSQWRWWHQREKKKILLRTRGDNVERAKNPMEWQMRYCLSAQPDEMDRSDTRTAGGELTAFWRICLQLQARPCRRWSAQLATNRARGGWRATPRRPEPEMGRGRTIGLMSRARGDAVSRRGRGRPVPSWHWQALSRPRLPIR